MTRRTRLTFAVAGLFLTATGAIAAATSVGMESASEYTWSDAQLAVVQRSYVDWVDQIAHAFSSGQELVEVDSSRSKLIRA